MQVYAMKFHNFLRFGETDNTIVFDLTNQQKRDLASDEITMDEIYAEVATNPVDHARKAKKRGLENQLGIVGIVDGDPDSSNGVGKSSIMEGICYAHYEKIVRKTANSDKNEKTGKAGMAVVTKIDGKFPKGLRESYVEEFLESNGSIYRIKRGRKFAKTQKSSSPMLEFECIGKTEIDKRGSHRTSDTNDSIEDVITMDYDVFVNSQMFGQNDAGKYLTGTDKTKKEMLINLLRLENVVVGCLELLRSKKNNQSKEVDAIKTNIDFLEQMVCKAYAKYKGESAEIFEETMSSELLTMLKDLREKGNERLAKCDKKSEETQKTIDELRKSDKLLKVSSIKAEGLRLKSEKEAKESDRFQRVSDWRKLESDAITDIHSQEGILLRKERKLKSIREEISEVKKENAKFNQAKCDEQLAQIDKSKKAKQGWVDSLNEHIKKREDLINEHTTAKTRQDDCIKEVDSLKSQIKAVSGEDFVCDRCKSKVTKSHILGEMTELEDNIKKLWIVATRLSVKKEKIEELIKSIRDKISQIDADVLQEATILGDIKINQAVSDRIKTMVASKDDMMEEIKELKKKLKTSNSNKVKYGKKAVEISYKCDVEIKNLQKKIVELREKFTKAKKDAESVELKLSELSTLMQKVAQVKNGTSEKIGFIDRDITHHAQLEVDLKKKRTEHIDSTKMLNRYLLLETVYGLDGIQTRIVRKYLPLLNVYIKEFLDILSRGSIGVKMIINDRSKIDMIISGASAGSYEMLSGGEKMIVRLAVDIGMALLSLSRSSQKPEIVCLDEIFANLDVNNTEAVFKMLDKLKDKFSRVIVISHNQNICERLNARIVIEKSSGSSGLSRILRIEKN